MEQVFDFREFCVKLWSKFKLVIIVGLIFGLLGGMFGFVRYPNADIMKNTATAKVAIIDKKQDATALTNAMLTINSVITTESFYFGALERLTQKMGTEKVEDLFGGDISPDFDDMKKVVNIFTKGNVIYSETQTSNGELAGVASKHIIDYAIEKVPLFFDGAKVTFLQQQNQDVTLHTNGSKGKNAVKFGVLGLGGGIILSLLFIFFVDIFDLKVKSADELKKYGLAVFATKSTKKTSLFAPQLAAKMICATAVTFPQKAIILAPTSAKEVDIHEKSVSICNAIKAEGRKVLQVFLDNNAKKVFANPKINEDGIDTISLINSEKGEPASMDFVNNFFEKNQADYDIIVVCGNDILTDNSTLNFITCAKKVLLAEKIKVSRTDEIEQSAMNLSALNADCLGIIL